MSIVVPSHNHAAYVESALASALGQTRPAAEIVVVDDGSTDGSVARLRTIAARHPGRVKLVARERRGAAATINEAVRAATGEWIAILNSDDRYAPARLEAMVDGVVARGAAWGYSRCRFVDGDGAALNAGDALQSDVQVRVLARVACSDTVGFGFLGGNPATTTGSLLFSRDLFERVGGFADLRFVHDWDFCLRATLLAEPAFVPRDLYDYRLHGGNTLLGRDVEANAEGAAMLAASYRRLEAHDGSGNRFAPVPAVWGRLFVLRAIEAGGTALLAPGTVERAADALLAELDP